MVIIWDKNEWVFCTLTTDCHATNSLEKGAPISLVKETLGHSSVAITSRYLHVRPDQSSSLYL